MIDPRSPRWLYRRNELSREGWESVVDESTPGWTHAGLRVARLDANSTLELTETHLERMFVPLAGTFTVAFVHGSSEETVRLSGRSSVFEGPSDILYLPTNTTAVVAGVGRLAVAGAATRIDKPVQYLPAAENPIELRGSGASSRQVHGFGVPPSLDAARLIVCEVLTPAGNWSSYPPHKHDEDVPGRETRLEEVYYFEIAPTHALTGADGSGFAMFNAYSSAAGELEISAAVRTGDVALIPWGYHGPAAAAPGYDLYYLNVMAGPDSGREWRISDDPAHAWVRKTWIGQHADDRLPFARTEDGVSR